jgi:hypothetical protein
MEVDDEEEEKEEEEDEEKEQEPPVDTGIKFQGSADYKNLVASLKRAAIPPGSVPVLVPKQERQCERESSSNNCNLAIFMKDKTTSENLVFIVFVSLITFVCHYRRKSQSEAIVVVREELI